MRLKLFLLLLIIVPLLAGCPPKAVKKSADTLKLTQQTVVDIAGVVDTQCSSGTLLQSQCDEAAKLYLEAQNAYSDALVAETLVIDAAIAGKGTEEAEALRAETMAVWVSLATRIVTLAAQYNIIEE